MTDKPQDPEIPAADPLAEMEHKYKLALADYQNLLKQTAKERTELALYANQSLILEMLPVYDNLKLSIKHAGNENSEWIKGIEHVVQQFKKALEEFGVKEIETNQAVFDPMTMEAVENRECEDPKLNNHVAEELKGGYTLHDKVIIPARVAVYNSSHPAA